jgi:MFS superfamily sulfate permease-like transporter
MAGKIAFNRNELAGSFGDLGTDLPLLMGMIAANGIDPASTFIVFGSLQILTGLVYRMPMPVQPLKAIAAIMITTGVQPAQMYGAGLVLGIVMVILSLSGWITKIAEWMPRCVVRGLQFGLGMSLMLVAAGYMRKTGPSGWLVAAAGILLVLSLGRNKRLPVSLVIVGLGVILAWLTELRGDVIFSGWGFSLPQLQVPTWSDLWNGTVLLALPQIPLSLGNSIIATSILVSDLFPQRRDVTVKKISLTYGLMNLAVPFFSGVPVCHGAGGLAGHFRFGARTGGSVILYGLFYLVIGLFFAAVAGEVVKIFPFPVLGVLLFFEGFTLAQLVRLAADAPLDLSVALWVGIMIISLPYGYLIGMVSGVIIYYGLKRGRFAL